MTSTMELAVMHNGEEDFEKNMNIARKKYNLNVRVLTMESPSGGWPVVRFSGTKKDLTRWLRNNYANDKEELNYLVSLIR